MMFGTRRGDDAGREGGVSGGGRTDALDLGGDARGGDEWDGGRAPPREPSTASSSTSTSSSSSREEAGGSRLSADSASSDEESEPRVDRNKEVAVFSSSAMAAKRTPHAPLVESDTREEKRRALDDSPTSTGPSHPAIHAPIADGSLGNTARAIPTSVIRLSTSASAAPPTAAAATATATSPNLPTSTASSSATIAVRHPRHQLHHHHHHHSRRHSSSSSAVHGNNPPPNVPSPVSGSQRAFWQAITVGELETVEVLLAHRDIEVNRVDEEGEQRQGCTALHLAIMEMPTWKGTEGRNGIQTAEFVRRFFTLLLEAGADVEAVCRYGGEWYLQTAAGRTKSFYPDGYDALGLVLQFIEITRGAEVISTNVSRRLELIRDVLLKHVRATSRRGRRAKRCSKVEEGAKKGDHNDTNEEEDDDDNDDDDEYDDDAAELGKREVTLANDVGKLAKERGITSLPFTDFVLRWEGATETDGIPVHRFVLAARSEVFAAMLDPRSGFAEASGGFALVAGVDAVTLGHFAHFLYTDALKPDAVEDAECLLRLLGLGNRFDVAGLKSRCARALSARHLTPSTAPFLLKAADEGGAKQLRTRVLRYISRNAQAVVAQPEFSTLSAELMGEVLRRVVVAVSPTTSSTSPTAANQRSCNKRQRGIETCESGDATHGSLTGDVKRFRVASGALLRRVSPSPSSVSPSLPQDASIYSLPQGSPE